MPGDHPSETVLSLAAASAGDSIVIRRILFSTLRSLCSELGIREGDVVQCRAGTSSHLLLRTGAGRTIPLERDWARFIQVVPAPATSPAPSPVSSAEAPATV